MLFGEFRTVEGYFRGMFAGKAALCASRLLNIMTRESDVCPDLYLSLSGNVWVSRLLSAEGACFCLCLNVAGSQSQLADY